MPPFPAAKAPPAPASCQILTAMIGAFIAIASTAGLSLWSGLPWLMAPFGATCVLAFGLPESPLAQPRNIVGGHLLSAAVGFAVLHTLGDGWLASALAVGLALGLMLWTRTVHAPAGANPLLVLSAKPALAFLLSPVLLGALVIVACALLVNNARTKGSYPRYWY